MELDLALCRRYLTHDKDFWDEACRALSTLENEPLFFQALAQLQKAMKTDNLLLAQSVCSGCFTALHTAYDDESLAYLAPCLLLALCLPAGIARMREAGADETMLRDTLADFSRWETLLSRETGFRGVKNPSWLLYPYVGRLLQIGRLQYETYLYPLPYALYRRRNSGELLCLCVKPLACDRNGRPLDAGNDPNGFSTVFSRTGGIITATAADLTHGVFMREPIQISAPEWELLLVQGQQVINLHIPRCGPLTPEAVDESLARARSFFAQRHIPSHIAVCDSWLLDPSLSHIAAPESNISRFMHRFYKYPVSADSSAVDYLFDNGPPDPAALAVRAKTSIQRRCAAYLIGGGRLYDTGGFLLL